MEIDDLYENRRPTIYWVIDQISENLWLAFAIWCLWNAHYFTGGFLIIAMALSGDLTRERWRASNEYEMMKIEKSRSPE
jgi:hypothetical protein